jgi:urate oxidase
VSRVSVQYEIHYGKADVKVYRTFGMPLEGVTPIPESPFTGRDNALMAAEIEVVVRGEEFLEAYTLGDNRRVVATDTMKNFIHAASLECSAATLEGWLHQIGTRFLETYPHMERLTMNGRQLPFTLALVPAADDGFQLSDRLLARDRNDFSTASLDLERDESGGVRVTGHLCGRESLQLIKLTGSAFADFARDEHTTLPERRDRPLYIWTDIAWRYADAAQALGADAGRYVDGQQVADLAGAVFHEFVSLSIQHLVHEIGTRMLERWPQLGEVSFQATNRLWDTVVESQSDPRVRSYCDPRPPFGRIGLVMRRDG